MKITLLNGIVVELNGVDEIAAVLPVWLPLMNGHTEHRSAEQIIDIEAESVIEDGTPEQPEHHRRSRRRATPNPPAPEGRWPDLIYLTETMLETYRTLAKYPEEGLTSEELAIETNTDPSIASGRAMRLREATPLIEMVGGCHRLTNIGRDPGLRIVIAHNPSPKNKGLGWDRFMAHPLRDGRHKKRRRP
jgi:hypothetical protein